MEMPKLFVMHTWKRWGDKSVYRLQKVLFQLKKLWNIVDFKKNIF